LSRISVTSTSYETGSKSSKPPRRIARHEAGIARSQWKTEDHPLAHGPVTPTRAAATITTHERPRKPPSVISADTRVAQWADRLQDIVDDEIEGGGDELGVVDLIAEAAGLLQNATDTALAVVDRQAGEARAEAQSEIAALRKRVNDLETARRAAEERHRSEMAGLMKHVEAVEATTRAEVEEVHGVVRLMSAEAAEARSVERLRSSSWSKRHRVKVGQRMAARELAKDAIQ
jgi:hypothetical protein